MLSRRRLVAAVAAVLLALPAAASATGADVALVTTHDGRARTALLHLPASAPETRPVPLLLVLHGLAQDGRTADAERGFAALAGREPVAVVYPEGVEASWNAGTCCGPAVKARVDDVGFLVHVVDLVAAVRPVDRSRVYVTGFSNGGMMALRAVCERPDVFAAAASVAGTLQARCSGGRPVSALLVHGDRDGVVPYGGLRWSAWLQTALTPVPRAAAALAARSGCTGRTGWRTARSSVEAATGCAAGAQVRTVVLHGMGHRTPTSAQDGVDGAAFVWSFLRPQRRR